MLKKIFSHESLISKIQEIGEKSNLIFYFISSNFISYLLQKSCQQFFPIMRFVLKYLNFNIPEVSSEVTDRFHRQIA